MGSWRKVGAFLGLVPDDNHPYDGDGYDGVGYDDLHDGRDQDGGYDREAEHLAYAGSSPYTPESDRGVDPSQTQDHHPAGREDSGAPAPRNGRAGRRSFSSEPVTQGSLAMKADQRRDMDSSTAARPASVKLTGFGEARIVGEKYRDGHSVILDMTDMSDADARRLVDFSAGLAFSLRGSIEKVAPKVFMLLPAEADIAGGAATALEDARAYVGSYAGR